MALCLTFQVSFTIKGYVFPNQNRESIWTEGTSVVYFLSVSNIIIHKRTVRLIDIYQVEIIYVSSSIMMGNVSAQVIQVYEFGHYQCVKPFRSNCVSWIFSTEDFKLFQLGTYIIYKEPKLSFVLTLARHILAHQTYIIWLIHCTVTSIDVSCVLYAMLCAKFSDYRAELTCQHYTCTLSHSWE